MWHYPLMAIIPVLGLPLFLFPADSFARSPLPSRFAVAFSVAPPPRRRNTKCVLDADLLPRVGAEGERERREGGRWETAQVWRRILITVMAP